MPTKTKEKPQTAMTAGARPDDDNGDDNGNGDERETTRERTTRETTRETPTAPQTPPPPPPTKPTKPAAATAETEFEKGVQWERARVLALHKLDRPSTHEIVTNAIAEGKSVGDITAEVVDAMDKASKQSARRADASALNGIPGSEANGDHERSNFGAKVKNAVDVRRKARLTRVQRN